MDLAKIDKNFATQTVSKQDVKWRSALSDDFSVHGITYSSELGHFVRMPQKIADQVNEGVSNLNRHTTGGRIRFTTNSPYIAIKALLANVGISKHETIILQYGFSVYVDDVYYGMIAPTFNQISHDGKDVEYDAEIEFTLFGIIPNNYHNITIFTPLYGSVKQLFIGLKEDSQVKPQSPYTHTKPVVFYGSSITQGGVASRAGNDYVGLISQELDTEILNLGFSGSARGEQVIAEYISGLDASVFVIDYDHNAKTVEHLRNTHLPFYKTIRNKQPTTPIVMISRPNYGSLPKTDNERKRVIIETYEHALNNGDKNVYFIDGETFFQGQFRNACTVDGTHPSDLGFYLMAKKIAPVIKKLLDK